VPRTVATAEPPIGLLDGRAVLLRGPAQPVQRPTPVLVCRGEDAPPFDGRAVLLRGPQDYVPTNPVRAFRGDDPPPFEGSALVGRYGFGDPRRPGRVTVARAEPPEPFAGSALVGKPPPPDLAEQQPYGRPAVARGEDAPPFAGAVLLRLGPLVPSDRLPPRPTVARGGDPDPFAGAAVALAGRVEEARPTRAAVAAEVRALAPDGLAVVLRAPLPPDAPQQSPGRVTVARAEDVHPDLIGRGAALVRSGLYAGAVPPTIDCCEDH
jgi:hypothetical protein